MQAKDPTVVGADELQSIHQNREANTVGSKAALKELADASMEMKVLIEQMREQVQNLE